MHCLLPAFFFLLHSKKMYSDAYPDYLRMTALNVPAALLVLGFLFSLDDLTGELSCWCRFDNVLNQAQWHVCCWCSASCAAWTPSPVSQFVYC